MLYLAITAGELEHCEKLPHNIAWMSCRFSSHDHGITNRPRSLPNAAIIILDDQIPIDVHDPIIVKNQLCALIEQFQPSGVVLDFQRPGGEEMAHHLSSALPCPTAVSERYAEGLSCPVFVSARPLCRSLENLWPGREKWLDMPIANQTVTLTSQGAQVSDWLPFAPIDGFYHEKLAVNYRIQCLQDQAVLTLSRDTDRFIKRASSLGFTRFFCLFREYSKLNI